MLWLKGWLETRFRLLFMLIFTAPLLFVMHSAGAHATASNVSGRVAGLVSHVIPFFIVFTCAFLAGAGIATQTSFQASKGLHGSALFTLSMPVRRLRLFGRARRHWMVRDVGGHWSPLLRDVAGNAAAEDRSDTD